MAQRAEEILGQYESQLALDRHIVRNYFRTLKTIYEEELWRHRTETWEEFVSWHVDERETVPITTVLRLHKEGEG